MSVILMRGTLHYYGIHTKHYHFNVQKGDIRTEENINGTGEN